MTLRYLWLSSVSLLLRFRVNQTRSEAVQVLTEEIQELHDATKPEAIARETVDVIVAALNHAKACGLNYQDIIEAAMYTTSKNDAKNRHNHMVKGGKITRLSGYVFDYASEAFIHEGETINK